MEDTSGSRPSLPRSWTNNKTNPPKILEWVQLFSVGGSDFISSVIPTNVRVFIGLAMVVLPLRKVPTVAKKDPHRGSCVSGTAA